MPKRLVKSTNKKLWGVAGGLAEYFNVDPTLVRVGFVVLTFICVVAGIVGYVALALLMPSPDKAQLTNRVAVVDNPDQDVR
ncbi:MAG: hypothetical protein BZY75_01825 [SAR202 cluster bacterium Io17-Chloro-G7]|nr:MAG: hypothetical protein BZY75_01825 [SAR202 cluster bacterium Io17-Chloro-G7]